MGVIMFIPSFETLQSYIDRGLVGRTDMGDLSIYNYTVGCQYSHAWDDVTMACRGLVLNRVTGEVVALPFGKFLNYGEDPEQVLPEGIPVATVKYDGSLGISFRHPETGDIVWTTRGSFYSTQAAEANRLWQASYAHVQIPNEFTLMAEIISPETRVVVDYGDREDLVLLGIRNRFTGEDLSYEEVVAWGQNWGIPVTERVSGDLESLVKLAKTLTHDNEGFVLRWPNGFRVKVKGQEYCLVARILSRFTPRTIGDVWYHDRVDIFDALPETHRQEYLEALAELRQGYDAWMQEFEAFSQPYLHLTAREAAAQVGGIKPFGSMVLARINGRHLDTRKTFYKSRFPGDPRPLEVSLDDDAF